MKGLVMCGAVLLALFAGFLSSSAQERGMERGGMMGPGAMGGMMGPGAMKETQKSGREAQTNTASIDRGRTLYETHCAQCHGATGKGDGPAAAALSSEPPDFTTSKFWQTDVKKKVSDAVSDGYGAMPPLGLNRDEIEAITDYITNTFKK